MRKLIFPLLGLLILAGCAGIPGTTDTPGANAPKLEDLGPAPELTNTIWFNTNQPLRLADLRGKVVLLEMWTYG